MCVNDDHLGPARGIGPDEIEERSLYVGQRAVDLCQERAHWVKRGLCDSAAAGFFLTTPGGAAMGCLPCPYQTPRSSPG